MGITFHSFSFCLPLIVQLLFLEKMQDATPANAGDIGVVDSVPGSADPLEEEMAAHSNILAW